MIFVFPRLLSMSCTKVLKAKSTFTLDLAEVSTTWRFFLLKAKVCASLMYRSTPSSHLVRTTTMGFFCFRKLIVQIGDKLELVIKVPIHAPANVNTKKKTIN